MLLDLLRLFGGPLLAAVIGGLIVHFATRRRDAENERRKQRIDYLLKAYRTLAHSTHRAMSQDQQEAFESALSDVVLLGDADQIRLSRGVIARLADGGEASVDDLLVSFRMALRQELDLKDDGLKQVPIVRFSQLDAHTPLRVVESWSVKREKTEAAVAAAASATLGALTATASGTAHQPSVRTEDFTVVDELRDLARVAPGAAIVSAYGQVRAALAALLDADEAETRDAPELAQQAADRGLITSKAVETVQGLAVMKDLSRGGGAGTGLTPNKAEEFIDLVAAMLYVVSRSQSDRQAS
ncbi:MAG: hypothetical protein AB7L91_14940 [Dehalococcoidia bacterium]